MLYNDELKIDTDPFSDWPKAYYKERDPLKREAFLLEKIKRLNSMEGAEALKHGENTGNAEKTENTENGESNSPEEEKKREEERLSVLYERYPSLKEKRAGHTVLFQKENTIVDRYMFSWMSILICGRTGIHFWNRKSLKKEVAEFLENFHPSEEGTSETVFSLRKAEWEAFASFWMETCATDKSYSSTIFGFLRMSDEALAKKMAQEIADAMILIPRALGLLEKARPVKEVFIQCYCKSIYQGEQYGKEYFQ